MSDVRPFRICTALIFLVLLGVSGTATADPSKREIDRMIERTMEEFDVPGMAVSVVAHGRLYYSSGQGILETGQDGQVDDETLFQIASVSKAFTAASLAILVDDGKLDWEDKVIDHLPEFRMYDPWVTREAFPRHGRLESSRSFD
jgi:CubicO group peptidase (beta-lactamase class C family)